MRGGGVSGAALAGLGAGGVYLLYTAVLLGRRGLRRPEGRARRGAGGSLRDWLAQAGLADVDPRQFVGAVAVLAGAGAALGFLVFGGAVPAVVAGLVMGALPVTSYRARRARLLEQAREAWPRMIEEVRLQTGGMGRSIPQALFEVGRKAPEPMRAAFAAAEQEWLVSTDLARSLTTLKGRLADSTADTVCETLLVAHEVGAGHLDRHLGALAEDRILELDGRRDATAEQAGARFARRFVLVVPLGMALAGLAIGDGRSAYETPGGQLAVAVGLAAILGCWTWAGRLMRLPEHERVFRD
jgi:tight adherence protein B